MATPRPPVKLAARGAKFWRETHATFVLTDAEHQILAEVCQTLDEIDALAIVVASDGLLSVGSAGQPVEHPAVGGLRSHRTLLGNLLKKLALPSDTAASGRAPSATSIKATRAAQSRWRQAGAR